MTIETKVCSPIGESNFKKYKTCFDADAIRVLVELYNKKYPQNPISTIAKANQQLKKLRNNVRSITNIKTKRAAELDLAVSEHLSAISSPSIAKSFRPQKPATWKNKPREWLTNFDIDAVMAQYNSMSEFKYRFLGVFPVDFAESLNGEGSACYIPEMCSLQLKKDIINNRKKYAGFIINLDKHDEPGSHWTSIFAVLDPTLPSYGAYYYDSVGRKWPPEIERYLNRWKSQMETINSKKKFNLEWSTQSHQHANTECGMFSMMFQILWIERLLYDEKRKQNKAEADEKEAKMLVESGNLAKEVEELLIDKKPTSFKMIVSMPLKDLNAFYLRDVLYRGGKNLQHTHSLDN